VEGGREGGGVRWGEGVYEVSGYDVKIGEGGRHRQPKS